MPGVKNVIFGLACLGAVLATVLASESQPQAAIENQTGARQQRIDAAAARACDGKTAVWTASGQVECLREVQP